MPTIEAKKIRLEVNIKETVTEVIKTTGILRIITLNGLFGTVDVRDEETIKKTIIRKGFEDIVVYNLKDTPKISDEKTKPKVYYAVATGPANGLVRPGTLGPMPDELSMKTCKLQFANGTTIFSEMSMMNGEELMQFLPSIEARQLFDPKTLAAGKFYGADFELPLELIEFRPIPTGDARSTKLAALRQELTNTMSEIRAAHQLVEAVVADGGSALSFELFAAEQLATARLIAAQIDVLNEAEVLNQAQAG